MVVDLADIEERSPTAFEQADDARPPAAGIPVVSRGVGGRATADDVARRPLADDAPEPPDCETLDAAAAAEAAGIDVDVTDLDGSADVSLPGFWTKSCSYGNGAMSLSTLSFNASRTPSSSTPTTSTSAGGVVLDVALGALPESSLVIQTGVADRHQRQCAEHGRTGGDRAADGPGRRVRGARSRSRCRSPATTSIPRPWSPPPKRCSPRPPASANRQRPMATTTA